MPPVVNYEWLETEGLPGQVTTEDIKMFARKGVFSSIGRAAVMATVAAVALTAIEPSVALAGSAPAGKGLSAARATSGATDFSARRRFYGGGGAAGPGDAVRARHHPVAGSGICDGNKQAIAVGHAGPPIVGGGGAAAAAAFAGIVGTGLAIAATQNRYYDDYYGGPVYYGGGPVYGGPVYYGGYGGYGGYGYSRYGYGGYGYRPDGPYYQGGWW